MLTLIITLILGVMLGLFLACSSLWLIKANCPKCKQPKPLKEIAVLGLKTRILSGKLCQKCQRPKPQIDIYL